MTQCLTIEKLILSNLLGSLHALRALRSQILLLGKSGLRPLHPPRNIGLEPALVMHLVAKSHVSVMTTNQNSLVRSRDWLSANQGPILMQYKMNAAENSSLNEFSQIDISISIARSPDSPLSLVSVEAFILHTNADRISNIHITSFLL
eukprot:sb/3473677/